MTDADMDTISLRILDRIYRKIASQVHDSWVTMRTRDAVWDRINLGVRAGIRDDVEHE